jgi:hypothetical protein
MIDFGKLVMAGQAAPMAIWLRDRGTERPTMLAELFAAAEDWRHSGKRLDLGRALAQVDPSLVDPQTGLPKGNVFGLYREVLGIRHHRPVETAFGDARCGRLERACSVSNRGTSSPPSTRGARREEQDPTELDVPEEVIA